MKHICFITRGYPTPEEPVFTFVRQLIASIADQGIKCSVISPQSVTKSLLHKNKIRPFHWTDITNKRNNIDVYQPYYFSVSNFNINNISITHYFLKRSIIKTFNKLNLKPDILYGHFWDMGLISAIIGKKKKTPVFVASGESEINVLKLFSKKTLNRYLPYINGVIGVSTKNKMESLQLGLISREKIRVIPNAIDTEQFYQENKIKMRKVLGYNQDDFIVAFTGAFNERKGVLRLAEAIKKNEDVRSIFIGSGDFKPNIKGMLFCGRVPHDYIRQYLSAADIFVLPTIAEGCSNAIVEAMACGLPIVSSDLSFNDDILNNNNSIRINSKDINQIANAIKFLKYNITARENMSKASVKIANELDIEVRAKKIIEYIEDLVMR